MTSGRAEVRIATSADVAALTELRRAWSEERGGRPDEHFAAAFTAWFEWERHQRTFWLAEDPSLGPVGMVNLLTFDRMPSPGRDSGRWGYLGNLYVRPAARGRGLGRRLIDAVISHADAAGHDRVVLSPSVRSVPLYRRLGFDQADALLLRPHPGTAGLAGHV